MREGELLRHIYERSADLAGRGGVVVGPGDDCAVVEIGGERVLLGVDQVVGGRHFEAGTDLALVARKAVARSVSDVAAMGGRPICGLATGCLPEGFVGGDALFDAMARWGREFGSPVVGGDIASGDGPVVLSVTVVGRAHAARGPVLRSGARAGDLVCVTGRVGGSLASGRHLEFVPRVEEGSALCDALGDRLTAMIDVSDGLGIDAGRVASASGVRVEIEASRVPLHEGVGDWRGGVGDGEDYELVVCCRAEEDEIAGLVLAGGTALTVIGRVVEGEGCVVVDETGAMHDAAALGWEHG